MLGGNGRNYELEDGKLKDFYGNTFEAVDLKITPILDKPEILSMMTDTESVMASGKVTYQLEINHDGCAEPNWVEVYFRDVNNEENRLHFWMYISYSEELGTYTGTIDLTDETYGLEMSEGTYKIDEMYLYDLEDHIRGYWLNGTKLEDGDGYGFEVTDLVVTPALETPIIRSMKPMKNSVEPEGTVTYQFDLDVDGYAAPSWVDVWFQDVDDEENIVNLWSYVSYSEELGTYIGTFDLAEEAEGLDVAEGKYKIIEVDIWDDIDHYREYFPNGTQMEDEDGNSFAVADLVVSKPAFILGDINEDENVDVSDLMYMLQVVSERTDSSSLTENQLLAGDVAENNGIINVDDLMKLLQYVSERISSLE